MDGCVIMIVLVVVFFCFGEIVKLPNRKLVAVRDYDNLLENC